MTGIAGLITINSGRLLETCRIETLCPPLFVTTTVAAGLAVLTEIDPKLSAAGLTPTPACTGIARNTEHTKNSPRNRHTNRVLFMRSNPSWSIKVRKHNGARACRSLIEILISGRRKQLVERSDLGQVFFGSTDGQN